MEKKEQLWERLAPIVLEREDGFGDITVGGATDQQGKDNLLNFISQELDKAREEGIFTQWELEYIRELAKEDGLFTRNVVEYNTDTELIKKISNLLKTKEDGK